jgi:hypothetical protein
VSTGSHWTSCGHDNEPSAFHKRHGISGPAELSLVSFSRTLINGVAVCYGLALLDQEINRRAFTACIACLNLIRFTLLF